MAKQKTATAELLGTIDEMLAAVGGTTKRAAALSEPTSIGGETTHATKNIDDGLQAATEGARSAENSADVKEQIGPTSVDSTSPTPAGSQQAQQPNIGVTSKATGEDSANETAGTESVKKDPGSTHPARTDNEKLGQHAEFNALLKKASDIGNQLMAALATPGTPAAPAQKQAAAPTAEQDAAQAAQAGYDAAAAATAGFDKAAFDQDLLTEVAATVEVARRRATKVAEAIVAMYKEAGANGEESVAPVAAGGGEGNETGSELSDDELMAALGGGQDAGGMGGDEMGGAPVGDMGGMGGGEMGGEGAPDDEAAMLLHVLEQAGITPEQLQALATKQAAAVLVEAKTKTAAKAASWQPKTAAQKRAAAEALAYVQELVKKYS